MQKMFKVTYTSGETEEIMAYAPDFRPGFVLFYNGETTRALGSNNIAEIEWGMQK